MGIFQRYNVPPRQDSNPSPQTPISPDKEVKPLAAHRENLNSKKTAAWNHSRAGSWDTARLLISDPAAVHDEVDPMEAKKLERKIDFMILPYLAVCYAFFYIDKTTLSYAAIFNIREDLNLKGTQYNWLSSIFYFGFLAWAFPTNFLMQRLPIGMDLWISNISLGVDCSLREISWSEYIYVVSLDTRNLDWKFHLSCAGDSS